MIPLTRTLAICGLLVLWFGSQHLLGRRGLPEDGIGDKLHQWLTPVHRFLWAHRRASAALLIASSLGIDGLGLFVIYRGIFGPSFAPIVGLAALMILRQLSQYLTALPAPEKMIWFHPGFPSLLVTYGVTNDLFFSGHTALAVYGGLIMATSGGLGLGLLGIGLALFEVLAVLSLRAHWTMDVYAGLVTAVLCFVLLGHG